MPTTPPDLDDLPAVPDRSDRNTFAARATAMFDALKNAFVAQLRALAENVFGNATEAVDAASTATTKRNEAVDAASAAVPAAATATAKRDEAVAAASAAVAAAASADDDAAAVAAALAAIAGGPVASVNGHAGIVVLAAADVGAQPYDAETVKRNIAQTFTAAQTFGKAAHETKTALAASNIDLNQGNYFTKTIAGATTLTVSNIPASGTAAACILELMNGGSAAVTWFAGVKWAGGTVPTLTAAGVDILGFYSHDGGTTWRGLVLAKDSK